MSDPKLTPLEEEFLLDLLQVQDQFQSSQIPAGTIRGKVMFRMAHRRGKTRPAPVHGLSEADGSFKSTFTRTLNRLVKRGFVERRPVGLGDFQGLPYQWGYGRHGKRDKDIFLSTEGRESALALRTSRTTVEPTPLPRATPRASAKPQPPTSSQSAGQNQAIPTTLRVNPRLLYHYQPLPGIQYAVVRNATDTGPRLVLYQHSVAMSGFDVIYEITRSPKGNS